MKSLGKIRIEKCTMTMAKIIDRVRAVAPSFGIKLIGQIKEWKCDGCNRRFSFEAPPDAPLADVVKAVRELLTEQGWQCGDPLDYCPDCVAKGKTEGIKP